MEETFTLHANPSIKRYNVGKFDDSDVPEFKEWKQPVYMLREAEKPDEEELDDPEELQPGNALFRKKYRRRRKPTRTPGWVLTDGNAEERLLGSLEGGMSASNYMVLMQSGDGEWSMVPVENWFKFKKPLGYRTLTLEEAEDMNNEKKRNVERWMMKHKVAGSKLGGGDTDTDLSQPRVRTGATLVTHPPASTDDDLFYVEEKAKSRVRKVNPEGDPNGEDGGDFNEKFSDDESDAEMTGGGVGIVDSDDENDDGTELKELSTTGQAMKDLLKRHGEDKKGATSSSSEEEEKKEEEGAEDAVVKHDLGGNVIRVEVEETKKNVKKRGIDEVGGSVAAATLKLQKTQKSDSSGGLTEKALQQQLIRYGGRMKTRDLLKKFKKHINTADDKALFRDILRTICDVHTDPIDGRMLVLKSHFM